MLNMQLGKPKLALTWREAFAKMYQLYKFGTFMLPSKLFSKKFIIVSERTCYHYVDYICAVLLDGCKEQVL